MLHISWAKCTFSHLEAVYSLGRYSERDRVIPENKKLRHLLFGKTPRIGQHLRLRLIIRRTPSVQEA